MVEPDQDESIKKRQDFFRELYLAGYDKANAFMALIVGAGYAGAFTLWDHVEAYLTYEERMLVAFFFGSSLTLFAGWQVRGQWVLSQQQLAISKIVSGPVADFEAMIEQFRVDQVRVRAILQSQLPFVFGLTSALGALGAIILLIVCLQHFALGHR